MDVSSTQPTRNRESLRRRAHAQPGPHSTEFLTTQVVEGVAALDALARIASSINIGATRPDRALIARQIAQCHASLEGAEPWRPGVLFLVTHAWSCAARSAQIVGSCKLQPPIDACWRAHGDERVVLDDGHWSALELAGNAVRPDARGIGVGRVQIQARLLFVLAHPPRGFGALFADLLTEDVGGRYPLYEHVVRPLLGGLDYASADALRYEDLDALLATIDGVRRDSGPVTIPLRQLRPELREQIARVRPITRRIERVLARHGFRPCDRYDLLDLGPYLAVPLDDLRTRCLTERLSARVASAAMPAHARPRTFTPEDRPRRRFVCVRAPVLVDRAAGTAELPQDVAAAVSIEPGTPIRLIRD
jgi:arginine/ornithine N-succinyltransferase beta subunit